MDFKLVLNVYKFLVSHTFVAEAIQTTRLKIYKMSSRTIGLLSVFLRCDRTTYLL